jgi:hypothetical protein
MYQTFHRTWWDAEGNPEIGRSTNIQVVDTREEAQELCEEWNREYREKHPYDKRSRKAEWTKI